MPLAGRPMIEWSLDAFRASASVRSIVVAAPPGVASGPSGRAADVWQVGPQHGPTTLIEGGATRAQSVSNALGLVRTELVAIHDAARPLVTAELVEALVADLESDPEAAGAIAAAPLTDTVKRARNGSDGVFSVSGTEKTPRVIQETLDRARLWGAQTPQVFRTEALREALAASRRPEVATDESMLVEAAGGRVLIHPVTEPNLKVTTPLDHALAEILLGGRSR